MKKLLYCLLILGLSAALSPWALAGSTTQYALSVGDTRTLYASTSLGTAYSYAWTSSHPFDVVITGPTSLSSCKIEVKNYVSSTVTIHCVVYYRKTVGNMTMSGQDYTDYQITVSRPRYTVTLDAGGGSVSPSTLTVAHGGTYQSLPTPSRSGYDFTGWFNSGGRRVYDSDTVTSSHVLTAHWTPSSYTVHFDGNGSTSGSMSDMTCGYSESVSLSRNAFEKEGCVFAGWNTRADGSGTGYADGAPVSRLASGGNTVTLYAIWNTVDHHISHCAITLSSASVSYTGESCTPAVTVRDGMQVLAEGADYTLLYRDNVRVGQASVRITGIGRYTGSEERTFSIVKAGQPLTVGADSIQVDVHGTKAIDARGVGEITYVSRDPDIASVDPDGVVTGIALGTTRITVTASGDENYLSGTKTVSVTVSLSDNRCGENLHWSLEGGTLYITGTGGMQDWTTSYTSPWYSRRSEITQLSIADGVTGIGDYAFYNCTGITEAVVPDSVTRMGEASFRGCSNLERITLPFVGAYGDCSAGGTLTAYSINDMEIEKDHVLGWIFGYTTSSGAYGTTFQAQTITNHMKTKYYYYIPWSLKEVIISNSQRRSTRGAFFGKDSGMGAYVTGIGWSVGGFINCDRLTRVVLPENCIEIESLAFYNCTRLESIEIPDGTCRIGSLAFQKCVKLTSLVLPPSIAYVGIAAFAGCISLNTLRFENPYSQFVFGGSMFLNDRYMTVSYPAAWSAASGWSASRLVSYGGTNITWSPYTSTPLDNAEIAAIPTQGRQEPANFPKPEVRLDGTVLREGMDYCYLYYQHNMIGTATVIAAGKGAYAGYAKTAQFEIKPVYTLIWLDGDGSVLDRGSCIEGEKEPVTDRIPFKATDGENTYAFANAWEESMEESIKTYTPIFVKVTFNQMDAAAPGVALLNGGTAGTKSVALRTADPSAEIYYTTDGTRPDPSSGSAVLYRTAFDLEETAVVKAMAVSGGVRSSVTAVKVFAPRQEELAGAASALIGGAVFTNAAGDTIESAADLASEREVRVSLSAEPVNAGPELHTITLFFAVYDTDGRLAGVRTREAEADGSGVLVMESFDLPGNTGSIRLIAADGDMVPLLAASGLT